MLDAATLEPVEGAEVRAQMGNGERLASRSDLAGVVNLGARGLWSLRIGASGYVGQELFERIGSNRLEVRLVRGGNIRVNVATDGGVPEEGAELLLIPPVQGKPYGRNWRFWLDAEKQSLDRRRARRLELGGGLAQADIEEDSGTVANEILESVEPEDWVQSTDARGEVTWSGLTPGVYRVGWLSATRSCLSPPFEIEPYRYESGKWIAQGQPVFDVTGPLEVGAGSTATVEITSFSAGVVFGSLDTGGRELVIPSAVKLFHQSIRREEGAPDLTLRQMEGSVVPAVSGEFEFQGFEPGTKRVTAHWRAGDRIAFSSVQFEAVSGQTVDLGVLRAQEGIDLPVRIALRDHAGKELRAEDVFVSGTSPELAVTLHSMSEPRGLPTNVSEWITCRFGETLVLSGLPQGSVHLGLELITEAQCADPSLGLTAPEEREFSLPAEGIVELAYVAARRVKQSLRVARVADALRLQALWRSDDGSVRGTTDLRPNEVSQEWNEYNFLVPAGSYRFFLHANALEAARSDSGWYWEGRLEVLDPPAPLTIHLLQGSAIRGTLCDARGVPLADRTLSLSLPATQHFLADELRYHAHTDPSGRFRVSSLPPSIRVHLTTGSEDVSTGPPGSEHEVSLRKKR